jgi:hypothetical protein
MNRLSTRLCLQKKTSSLPLPLDCSDNLLSPALEDSITTSGRHPANCFNSNLERTIHIPAVSIFELQWLLSIQPAAYPLKNVTKQKGNHLEKRPSSWEMINTLNQNKLSIFLQNFLYDVLLSYGAMYMGANTMYKGTSNLLGQHYVVKEQSQIWLHTPNLEKDQCTVSVRFSSDENNLTL